MRPTVSSTYILCLIFIIVSWLVYQLLKRCVPACNNVFFKRFYWVISLATAITLTIVRRLQPDLIPIDLFRFGFTWMMGQIMLLLASPLIFVTYRLLAARLKKSKAVVLDQTDAISRRCFLQASGAALPLAVIGTSFYSVFVGGSQTTIQRRKLFFNNFPESLDGLKIVQISDAHIGLFFSMTKLDETLAMVEREQPDMLVITGDLLDDLALLQPTVERLSAFSARLKYGIYFTWGNHEYFRNINAIRKALENSPITVLENSSKLVVHAERPFYVLGVDYPWTKRGQRQSDQRNVMFQQALRGVPDNAFKILLSHHPDFFDNAFAADVPLSLAGHTHGGQVALFGRSLLPVQYKYMRGLYEQNGCYGYVSTGTGSWFPFRFGCPAEISVFTLQCTK